MQVTLLIAIIILIQTNSIFYSKSGFLIYFRLSCILEFSSLKMKWKLYDFRLSVMQSSRPLFLIASENFILQLCFMIAHADGNKEKSPSNN